MMTRTMTSLAPMARRLSAFAVILLLVSGLSACGGKQKPGPSRYQGPPCQDVLSLPQDLNVYAAAAGGPAALVPASEQAAAAARQKDRVFRPWRISEPSKWVQQSLEKNFNMRLERGFSGKGKPFPSGEWEDLVANSNKEAFGAGAGPAISLRHSNLRAMPTASHYYLKPELPGEGYPFDYFQHTSIPPGTPLYVHNVSRDGRWVLAESAVTSGWLPADDIAMADDDFMQRWQSHPLAALVRDNVQLGGGRAHIGTLLPMPGGSAAQVLLPVRGASGRASAESVMLAPGDAVAVPLTLSANNVARVGGQMIGQAYGWGGIDEKRDCSALTRDLMAPFGVYLPRNSASQGKVGQTLELAGMSLDEKEARIKAEAAPFRSLVWLKGHIGLYLGVYQGKPLLFHNMWGLGINDPQFGCDGRAVVGKAVVTTLRPGIERPDLCTPGSFLERIERVAVLPGVDAYPAASAPKAVAKPAPKKASSKGKKQGGAKKKSAKRR